MDGSRVAARLRNMVHGVVKVNEPLKPLTTLRIGGPADIFITPAHEDDVLAVVRWCREAGLPLTVLGAGSNILVPDEGLRGVVLRTRPGLDGITFSGDRVRAGAGAPVARLVARASRLGLAGAECLAGVPGTVGGALVMNAGTRTGSIGSRVMWVRAADSYGRVVKLLPKDLEFGYRFSVFQKVPMLVLDCELQLEPGNAEEIRAHVDGALHYRNETQPLHLANAGSTFKNPPGRAAGRLIDEAGCKGLRRGDAQVSTMHSNWVVNLGEARAADVLALMLEVYRRVWDRFAVALEPELRLLGPLAREWEEAAAAIGPPSATSG